MKTDSVHVDAGGWKLINWSLAEATVGERNAGVAHIYMDASSFLKLQSSGILNFPLWRLTWKVWRRLTEKEHWKVQTAAVVQESDSALIGTWNNGLRVTTEVFAAAVWLHSAWALKPITLRPWYQTPNLNSSHPLYMTGFPAVWIEHPLPRLDNSLKKEKRQRVWHFQPLAVFPAKYDGSFPASFPTNLLSF